MKNNYIILSIFCLLLNITFGNAQISISASSNQNSIAVNTNNTLNVWNEVTSTSITLNNATKVLVEATIEINNVSNNSDMTGQFRLTDGSNFSKTIKRFIAQKSYDDKGIAAISFIFEYPGGTSETKNYTLQHSKFTGNNGANLFSSKAVITAIEIASDNGILPNSQATADTESTLSPSYVSVASTSINLPYESNVYVVSTFSTSTSNALADGSWALRQDNSPISEITRSILDPASIGAGTIITLLENIPAGPHTFDLAHKSIDGNNITTSEATISVIALTTANGEILPSISSLNGSGTSSINNYTQINQATLTAPLNGIINNKLFLHTTFNMSASNDDIAYATYKIAKSGTPGIFTSFEIQRYVPDTKTGSGGLIGIVSDINEGSSFDLSFEHKNSGESGILSSTNVNSVGFFLNSDPSLTLSVEEEILNTNILIYPNPSRDFLYLGNNVTNGETSFKFYTVTGQLMHTINVLPKTNTKIDVTGWTSGIYIMRATNNGVNIAKKLIIE